MDRDAYLRAHITTIAEDTFPDDTGLDWKILAIEAHGESSAVTVEPSGNVGYPRFVFLVNFAGPNPECIATYALAGAGYTLLCTPAGLTTQPPKTWPPK